MGVLEYGSDNVTSSDEIIFDEDWLETTLSANIRDYEGDNIAHLYRTGVMYETMDTSIGGNLCINPPYGFTPGADSYYKGRMMGRVNDTPDGTSFNIGMGRKYYEYIQQNSPVRTLSLEFGVPEFKNIVSYLMGAIDYSKMIIVNEGRSPTWYYIGQAIGIGAAFVANPIFTASFYIITKLWNVVFGLSDPRFYHMKPSMHTFYMSVNNMMQLSAAERGFTRLNIDDAKTSLSTNKVKITEYEKGLMAKEMPNIFNSNGVIDVLSISSRYQLLLNTKLLNEAKLFDGGSVDDYTTLLKKPNGVTTADFHEELRNLSSFIADTEKKKDEQSTVEEDYKKNSDGTVKQTSTSSWTTEAIKYYKSAATNTSNAIFLQVEYLGVSTDSFSNTTKELPVKSFMDSTSSAFRDIRFSLGSMDIINQTATEFLKNSRDVAMGVLDGASFGLSNIIHSLIGGGYVDLPLMWDDSTANIEEHSFKISLNFPYGNTASLLTDMDLVLYSILAGMLPRSIGRSAYGSPLLCKAFVAGSVNIDFGMISSLTVARGSGNIGHNVLGSPLNTDITFTIKDFNEIFSAPTEDGFLGAYNLAIDDYQIVGKYIKMMAGTSYSDSKFIARRSMIRLNAIYGGLSSILNPQALGFLAGNTGMNKVFYNASNLLLSEQSGVWMFNE